jgi:transcriptional regulator with XRE-family HTH domain
LDGFNLDCKGNLQEVKATPQRRFGQNVCKLRVAKGLTQAKLAERADISTRHLQRIESGERNPSVGIIAGLRLALDCSWTDLFAGFP